MCVNDQGTETFLYNCDSTGTDVFFLIESSHSNVLQAQCEILFLRLIFIWLDIFRRWRLPLFPRNVLPPFLILKLDHVLL